MSKVVSLQRLASTQPRTGVQSLKRRLRRGPPGAEEAQRPGARAQEERPGLHAARVLPRDDLDLPLAGPRRLELGARRGRPGGLPQRDLGCESPRFRSTGGRWGSVRGLQTRLAECTKYKKSTSKKRMSGNCIVVDRWTTTGRAPLTLSDANDVHNGVRRRTEIRPKYSEYIDPNFA